MKYIQLSIICNVCLLTACGSVPKRPDGVSTGVQPDRIIVLDPTKNIEDVWEHYVLRKGETQYSSTDVSWGPVIEARGRKSASMLVRVLDSPAPDTCTKLVWNWSVLLLQKTANIKEKITHDVGASLFVSFGDIGPFRDRWVPTIQYAWTTKAIAEEEVLIGPYHQKYLRTIVIERGLKNRAGPVLEQRDVFKDFEKVFGYPSPLGVHSIAIFTDNDDTGEPVHAHYGKITLLCEQT